MQSSPTDAVLDRAFRLLDAFRAPPQNLTLDELTARSGLPRSTAHRLAGQLERLGALERSRRGWRLGTRLFELGQMVPRQQRLRDVALAYMEDLYEATRETVQLAVLDDGEVLYVEIISGHRRVPTPSRRGGRMPAHCTALGKAMLAFSADAGQEWIAQHPVLAARTSRTLTDPALLRRELHDVRRLGPRLRPPGGRRGPRVCRRAAAAPRRDGPRRAVGIDAGRWSNPTRPGRAGRPRRRPRGLPRAAAVGVLSSARAGSVGADEHDRGE